MSMYELTSVLWHRKLQAGLLALLLFVAGSLFALSQRSTSYTARSQVVFDQPQLLGNLGGINVPGKMAQMIPTFCRLMGGDREVAAIATRAEVDEGTVRGATACSAVLGTTVVVISARAGSAGLAQRLSRAAARTLAEDVNQRYNGALVPPRERVQASVLVAAGRPHADPDRTARRLLLTVVGSILLAGAIVIAAEPHRRLTVDDIKSGWDSAEPAHL